MLLEEVKTLKEESKKRDVRLEQLENVKRYYDMGKYTNEQVKVFVQGKKITEQEYELITGEKYEAIVE